MIDAKRVFTMKRNSFRYLAFASLAIVFAVSLWAQTPVREAGADVRKAWQHLAFEHEGRSVTGDRELARKINELGRGGWELLDVETFMESGSTIKMVFFFKKPL
jgi:hypothetical protein